MDHTERERLRRGYEALERVTDGIVALDADLRYTYVNGRAEEILDGSSDELLGETVWSAFPEAAGTVAQERIEEALETQEPRSYERYNEQVDRWFDVRIYPDDAGVSLYFDDVTERKQFERDLERTNRQLTALVENSSEAIYIKDRDGYYQLINEAAAELFGLTPVEAVGKHDEELFDPESGAQIRAEDERIAEREEPVSREVTLHIDGEEHVFLSNKYPYRDEEGDVVGVMGISRDITERKRRERELRELSEEYEAIFENAEDSIFLIGVERDGSDPEFRIERISPSHEAATGLDVESVNGKTPREALGDELGAEVEANYRRCIEAGEPLTYEEEPTLPNGESIWQTKLAPVVVDGEVTRIVGISRDVTDRVERERELHRKNERLAEFASVISHDLRNPLNVAQGRATLLREQVGAEHAEHVEPLGASLDRMEAIIDDTLTLARQGETVGETANVTLTDLVGQCWGGVETADATIEIADECTIRGDRDRLRHVFENLFRNAVEHGGDSVTVRVGRVGDGGIYVEDDGVGIPEEKRERIFEAGHSSAAGGTGFGLTIVRRIAEAHGWEVEVTDGPEGGARFEFTGVEIVD